jgi:hypothetical protein
MQFHRAAPILALVANLAGCATMGFPGGTQGAQSPMVLEKLQVVSAGHTGCLPQDNHVSILWTKPDGSGLWKATCNSKTYLCSAVATVNGTEAFSCAPEAQ